MIRSDDSQRSFALKDSCIAKRASSPGRRPVVLAAAVVALVWAAVLAVGGCTNDPANPLGGGLIDNQIDSTLSFLEIVAIDNFAGLRTDDADELLQDLPTLYLGSEEGLKASFVVNFDFSDIFTDEHPAEDYTFDNVNAVKLRFIKYTPYAAFDTVTVDGDTVRTITPTGQPQDLYFFAHELDEPFDNSAVETAYPLSVKTVRAKEPYQGGTFRVLARKDFISRFRCSVCHVDKKVLARDATLFTHSDIRINHGKEEDGLSCNDCHNEKEKDFLVL